MALGLAACGGSGGGDSPSPSGNNGSGAAANTDNQGNGDHGSHSGNGDNGDNAGNGGNSGNGSNGGNGGNAGNGGNGSNGGNGGGSTAQAPATPTLSALRAGDHINFSWNNVGASSYTLYYSRQEITAQNLQTATGKFTQLTGTKTTISPTTTDSKGKHVQLAGRYYFALQAANGTATSAPSANVVAGLGFVNETNIDKCGSAWTDSYRWDLGSNTEACHKSQTTSKVAIPTGQDGHIGTGKNGSKHMTMTTIKKPNGEQCVQDARTGLMWEVKDTAINSLRSATHKYQWYNTDMTTNGGNVGANKHISACTNMPYNRTCTTSDFVATVNAKTLCGFNDWRLPTSKELIHILDYSAIKPAADLSYFPNTQKGIYWSATPNSHHPDYAMAVDFNVGQSHEYTKATQGYIRLVRNSK